eukprot:c598_g1_i1.p1 GENE.c598_g1_i1~~c598_g1_i1.p1  ORF type:complete len:188 (-),score=34.06 c598_g1_i1:467-1030(-)
MADETAIDMPIDEAFQTAVVGLFLQWPALAVAVDSGWAKSGDAVAAREDLIDEVLAYLEGEETPPPDVIETLILDVLSELFAIDMDDGSAKLVANVLCKMRRERDQNDRTEINKMLAFTAKARASREPPQRVAAFDDSDSGSGDYEHADEDAAEGAAEPAAPPASAASRGPQTDEDGWTTVAPKRRK